MKRIGIQFNFMTIPFRVSLIEWFIKKYSVSFHKPNNCVTRYAIHFYYLQFFIYYDVVADEQELCDTLEF